MPDEQSIVLHPTSHDRRVEDAYGRPQRALLYTRGTFSDIRQEVMEKLDLKKMVRSQPGLFLALAFVTGFVLPHRP